jgi:hypothetical protein
MGQEDKDAFVRTRPGSSAPVLHAIPLSRTWPTVCFHVLRYSLQLRAASKGSNFQQRGPLLTLIL